MIKLPLHALKRSNVLTVASGRALVGPRPGRGPARVAAAGRVEEAGAVIPRLHGEGGAGAAQVAQGEAGQPAAREAG